MALRFYSLLPTGSEAHLAPDLNRMAPVLPLASFLIGLGPSLFLAVWCVLGMSPLFGSVIAVGLFALITGAMSEDAFGDTADGLLGGRDRSTRLTILKDSRMGAYGTIAIVLVLLARIGALTTLSETHPVLGAVAWISAGLLARSGSFLLPLKLTNAREDGVAASAEAPGRFNTWLGIGFAICLAAILSFPFTQLGGVVLAVALSALIIVGWVRWCASAIGGYTGDLIGGLQAALEIAGLAAFIIIVGL